MSATCLNLETLYGTRFRITMSEDHVPGSTRDPWNFQIPCKRWKAVIYPHGGSRLQTRFETRFTEAALALLQPAGAEPWQVGDGEATAIFDVKDAEAVFGVLRPVLKPKGASPERMAAIRPPQKVTA